MAYYKTDPRNPPKVQQLLDNWVEYGDKPRNSDQVHYYPLEEIWPYREYTWTRETARQTPEEWDALVNSFQARGWESDNPLWLLIGKNGKAKVGEGNHRLAVAKDLGVSTVPVVFEFRMQVEKEPQGPVESPARPAPKPVELPEQPRRELSKEEEERVNRLLQLLTSRKAEVRMLTIPYDEFVDLSRWETSTETDLIYGPPYGGPTAVEPKHALQGIQGITTFSAIFQRQPVEFVLGWEWYPEEGMINEEILAASKNVEIEIPSTDFESRTFPLREAIWDVFGEYDVEEFIDPADLKLFKRKIRR